MKDAATARVFILCLLLAAMPAMAHELRPGYLEISEISPGDYNVVWKAPVRAGRPLPVEAVFPEHCMAGNRSDRPSVSGALIASSSLRCEAPLAGSHVELSGLDATLTDVLVRVQLVGGATQTLRATPDAPLVVIARSSASGNVVGTYFLLGVEHILTGVDHLLFVLALVLLISGVRRLVETITAFTVAHSITLIVASLGWMRLPSAPVEAVIALSIVFLANEVACKQRGVPRLAESRPWLVAFAFGLLHGFGFAGALAEIGLPEGDVPVALLMFNLGVEAGQLAFLAVVLAVLAVIAHLRWRRPVDAVASYAIGITASAWLFERLI